MEDWVVDGRPKGVTEERLTLKRCVGRNVHRASLRGEGISLAVHDGGWQARRRATDGSGRRSTSRAISRGVAQLGRALACQARGRRFESGRPRSLRGGCGVTGEHSRL